MSTVAVVVPPQWDRCQLSLSCCDSKARVRDIQMRLDRAMCSSTAAVLDPHQTYPLPLRNDGISRSPLSIDLDAFPQVAVKMAHQTGLLLENQMRFSWTCDKEYPTLMLCLLKVSFEASGVGLSVDWQQMPTRRAFELFDTEVVC